MARSAAAAPLVWLLLFAQASVGACGGFLSGVKGVPDKILPSVKGKAPSELAQAIKDEVAKTSPTDIADAVQDAMNSSSLQDVADAAKSAASDTLEKLSGSVAAVSPANASEGVQQQLSEALRAAGKAIQQGADTIANTSSADALDAVKEVGGSGLAEQATKGHKDLQKLKKAGPQDVADALRRYAPKVAKEVNKTGLGILDTLAQGVSQVSLFAQEASSEVANRLSDGGAQISQDIQAGNFSSLLVGSAILFLALGGGCMVFMRSKASKHGLLSEDSTGGVQISAGSARTPSLLAPDSESTSFAQFR